SSDEDRQLMETEESIRQIVDGDFNEEMQKIRYELKKRSEENERLTAEKKQAIAEKEQVIAEKDKQIAELLARLNFK
ncbi:MAG: hypothetical protein LBE12_20385, partial [Planctomycetaceae bacterium]|nr:hypothetical protein [Planctomycetaceae bacterium]